MASQLNPYVNFRGQAREALDFYASVFGGEPAIMTFGQFGDPPPGADADGVMHGQLDTPMGYTLMISDVPGSMDLRQGDNVSLSLSGDDADALRGFFSRLADGGEVTYALEKQMWGDEFGMLKDRYGLTWLVNISAAQA